jgi:tetratricopeptide (TPR) repeat protein
MAKRTIIASSCLALIVCAGLVVFALTPAEGDSGTGQLGQAKSRIQSLVKAGRYADADAAIEKLKVDFVGNPDLPEAINWLANEFRWVGEYNRASRIYEDVAEQYAAAAAGENARLGLANVDVLVLIAAGKYGEATAAIDKMCEEFSANPGLAETLYWVTSKYEWKMGEVEDRATRYDVPMALYRRLAEQFLDSPFAERARWDYKRLMHRTRIFVLMGQSDQNAVDSALAAMETDFAGRRDLVMDGLYWTGKEYELHAHQYDMARAVYERIATEFTDIPEEANAATADTVRVAIESDRRTGQQGHADEVIGRLRLRTQGTPRLAGILYWAGAAYQQQGTVVDSDPPVTEEQAAGYLRKALELYIEATAAGVRGPDFDPSVSYAQAECYVGLKDYRQAIEGYKAVVRSWPSYKNACLCQMRIAYCYEKLYEEEDILQGEAADKICEACRVVLRDYPDCGAARGISQVMLEKWEKYLQ